jgi:hypothetical protein
MRIAEEIDHEGKDNDKGTAAEWLARMAEIIPGMI